MPKNVEIKAIAFDYERQIEIAKSISEFEPEKVFQKDIFFNVAQGRLKLRVLSPDQAELIYYSRSNKTGPKLSEYEITETSDPNGLEKILKHSYGVRNTVEKTRLLFMSGRTRIHFDSVERLGRFIELEVVLEDGEKFVSGEKEAESLMEQLEIGKSHLVDVAYVDLLDAEKA
jgi:predicted adenylyl cyclase CyaB